jgi:hypothetical protein
MPIPVITIPPTRSACGEKHIASTLRPIRAGPRPAAHTAQSGRRLVVGKPVAGRRPT